MPLKNIYRLLGREGPDSTGLSPSQKPTTPCSLQSGESFGRVSYLPTESCFNHFLESQGVCYLVEVQCFLVLCKEGIQFDKELAARRGRIQFQHQVVFARCTNQNQWPLITMPLL